MRVLVTGGAGFIGSHTCELLRGRGHEVRVLDDLSTGRRANLAGLDVELVVGSVADPGAVAGAVRGVEAVVHLAAVPGVPASCEDPVGTDRVNGWGTVVVLEAARRAGVRRVVLASSCAVYGSGGEGARREDEPLAVESPYAASKAASELHARAFSRTLGLSCVALRYFNVFGPRQDPDGPYAAVVPRFVARAIARRPLVVFGDGRQTRDFVAVEDVARANLAALEAPGAAGRVYNIGTGRAVSVLELARLVGEVFGRSLPIEHAPPRPGDIRHMRADPARAARELGWRAEADFAEAMRATVDGYRRALVG